MWPFRNAYAVTKEGLEGITVYQRWGEAITFPITQGLVSYITGHDMHTTQLGPTSCDRFRAMADAGALMVIPVQERRDKVRGHMRSLISAKAEKTWFAVRAHNQTDTIQQWIHLLQRHIPAASTELHTEEGVRVLCSTCPNMFGHLQGMCTPAMPECIKGLNL